MTDNAWLNHDTMAVRVRIYLVVSTVCTKIGFEPPPSSSTLAQFFYDKEHFESPPLFPIIPSYFCKTTIQYMVAFSPLNNQFWIWFVRNEFSTILVCYHLEDMRVLELKGKRKMCSSKHKKIVTGYFVLYIFICSSFDCNGKHHTEEVCLIL